MCVFIAGHRIVGVEGERARSNDVYPSAFDIVYVDVDLRLDCRIALQRF